MNAKDYLLHLLPKTIAFKLVWRGWIAPVMPIIITYSVTAACQSKCRTCNIGIKWLEDPSRSQTDLSLDEIEKIFRNIGPVYLFNVSGGEPFLRKDLPKIIELACRYLQPSIIHIPTNALTPGKIDTLARECLDIIQSFDPETQFSIKPSIDGVEAMHDEVRGVKGNFDRLKQHIDRRKEAELGITIGDKRYWSRGYGRDTVVTFLRHLFTEAGLHRVYLNTLDWNVRAQQSFHAAGFSDCGTVRRGVHNFITMEAARDPWLDQHPAPQPLSS